MQYSIQPVKIDPSVTFLNMDFKELDFRTFLKIMKMSSSLIKIFEIAGMNILQSCIEH